MHPPRGFGILSTMERSRGRGLGILVGKLALSLALTLGLLEGLLHVVPALIPSSYRRLYPLHGVGFFEPELLARTPIDTVPLPLYVGSYRGRPPQDLVGIGMVDPEASPDPLRYPEVELRVDALGLPNDSVPERADVVLVGDSFVVGMGVAKPRGLQVLLAEALGKTVYSLGVAATGPLQQRWLLENQGLPKEPSLVLWFFFGGNDTVDVATTLLHQHRGEDTYGKVHAGREPPTLRLPAIVRYVVGSKRAQSKIEPLPGLVHPAADGGSQPVWMHPGYLLSIGKSTAQWEADPAWGPTKDVLRGARDLVEAAGARFVLVYLPSKPQVYLPCVEHDPDLVHRMLHFQRPELVTPEPEAFLEQALAHRGALEELMAAFCAEEGIEYLSATACLEAQARRGELGYLSADTHWAPAGQREFLPVLLAAIGE